MRSSFARSIPLALVLFASASVAATPPGTKDAPSREESFASPRVAPETHSLFAHRARTGRTFPAFRPNRTFERTGLLPVVVRFVTGTDGAKIEKLVAGGGIMFDRSQPTASGAYLARIDEHGLERLEHDPDVARVSVDMFRSGPRPDDAALSETKALVAKRAAIAKNGARLDGDGMIIADIDSPYFMHHPAFYRADGGAFPFVDVDGNGKLTVGIDGIDVDGSGTIEPEEVLQRLESRAISRYTSQEIESNDEFTADVDYLYLDLNGNGLRDFGSKESTAAYGEPLYVFDDANHDGVTQASERVLQLKTSKIKTVSSGDIYERGKNLAKYHEATADYASYRGHATGVLGILAGGQPGISRWTGLAPNAEIILGDTTSSDRGLVTAIEWAIESKADVVLTEYAPYTNVSLDGSSEDETILDSAFDQGTIPVSPAGNLAIGHKHRTLTLQPGVNKIPLTTSSPGAGRYAAISMHHRGAARTITAALKLPTGATIDLPESLPDGQSVGDNMFLYVNSQTTPRGTHERFVNLLSYGGVTTGDPLPKGNYELSLTLDAGTALEVDLFSADDVSDWAGGFSFIQNTETRTICSPSTSDKTISVAAYVLHDEPAFYPSGAAGDLAGYSSRGPTFDGKAGIEIAAPDNPISAAPPEDDTAKGSKSASWEPFGGTSGAGPHVAAAVALMREANPQLTPNDLKKRLLDGAIPSGDEKTFGKGKLDIAAAVGATIADGDAPKVTIETVAPPYTGSDAKLLVKVDDDEDTAALTARWDLDYDGTFDTDWLPLGEQTIALADVPEGTRIGVKVEVRDGQGNLNGATLNLDVLPPAPPPAAPPASSTTTEGCGCRVVASPTDARTNAAAGALAALGLAFLVSRRRRS